MSNSSEINVSGLAASGTTPGSGRLRWVFVGKHGLRAGWGALLFVAIYQVLGLVLTTGLGHFISLNIDGPIPLTAALLQESLAVLAVFIATWVMARIEERPVLGYGYSGNARIIRLASGALLGFLCLSTLAGVLWKAGFLVFDGWSLTGFTAWKYALGWALLFLLVGLSEESLLRGYMQHTLSRGIGFWWAALLLSVVFSLGHAVNGGESLVGLLEVGFSGLVFCLSLWYTKSLLWAVGFHAGWDWAQSFFYGTADSGLVMKEHLLTSHASGNPLWSGGATGPEGSLLILPLLILVAAAMWIWWGGKEKIPGVNS